MFKTKTNNNFHNQSKIYLNLYIIRLAMHSLCKKININNPIKKLKLNYNQRSNNSNKLSKNIHYKLLHYLQQTSP